MSNHELNVKIVLQHESYDHGKHSSKPGRAYYTDYMKEDGWQVTSFEHIEGQWEMTLLRASLENQPLELDWYSRGRILIFSPPFTKPVELEEVEEEEAPGGVTDRMMTMIRTARTRLVTEEAMAVIQAEDQQNVSRQNQRARQSP